MLGDETSLIVNGLEAHIFEYTFTLWEYSPLEVMQMLVYLRR